MSGKAQGEHERKTTQNASSKPHETRNSIFQQLSRWPPSEFSIKFLDVQKMFDHTNRLLTSTNQVSPWLVSTVQRYPVVALSNVAFGWQTWDRVQVFLRDNYTDSMSNSHNWPIGMACWWGQRRFDVWICVIRIQFVIWQPGCLFIHLFIIMIIFLHFTRPR